MRLDVRPAAVEDIPESVRLEYLDGNERAAAFYAAKGFVELRREPGEQPGWPDTVWVERRCQTPGERRS